MTWVQFYYEIGKREKVDHANISLDEYIYQVDGILVQKEPCDTYKTLTEF